MNRREIVRKRWKKLLEVQNINILFPVSISSKFQNTISKTQPTIGEKDQNGCRWNRPIFFSISFERFLRESRWFEVMKRTELCSNCTVRQQQNDMHFIQKTSHTIERSSACIAHPSKGLRSSIFGGPKPQNFPPAAGRDHPPSWPDPEIDKGHRG